jgi:flagellar hook-associated protein 2
MTGTIGGLSASSSDGINLQGSGALAGVSLKVIGGSTGSRGSIIVSDGLATQMNDFLKSYTDSMDGQFKQRTTQLSARVKQLDQDQQKITALQTRLTSNYMAQYGALDTLMSKMSNTASFLMQQLAKL